MTTARGTVNMSMCTCANMPEFVKAQLFWTCSAFCIAQDYAGFMAVKLAKGHHRQPGNFSVSQKQGKCIACYNLTPLAPARQVHPLPCRRAYRGQCSALQGLSRHSTNVKALQDHNWPLNW